MNELLPKYQAEKFQDGKLNQVEDYLSVEEALQININSSPFTVIMRSPGNEIDFIRGLLYNEDIYTKSESLTFSKIKKNKIYIDRFIVSITCSCSLQYIIYFIYNIVNHFSLLFKNDSKFIKYISVLR